MDGGLVAMDGAARGVMPARPVKRSLEIATALSWAYVEELPKRETMGSLGASRGSGLATYGTSIENWDRDPGYPVAMGAPHEDALTIDAAVQGLPVSMPLNAWHMAAELAPECYRALSEADAPRLVSLRLETRALVIRSARMGRTPDWTSGGFSIERTYARNGKIRVEGMDAGGRHGFCPLEVLPDPRWLVIERAEYTVWWRALSILANDLANRLSSITVREPIAQARPWLVEPARKPAILPDLSNRWITTPKGKKGRGTWA